MVATVVDTAEDVAAAVAVELAVAALAAAVAEADTMVVAAVDRRNFLPTKSSCSVRSRVSPPGSVANLAGMGASDGELCACL